MEINGFTFFAQIVNFLILVWLLKRFLYGPILGAMDAREARLAGQLEQAAQQQEAAAHEAAAYEALQEAWHQEQQDRLKHAREEVEAYRRELMQQARDEVAQVQAGWTEAVRREQAACLEALRRQTGTQVLATTRRVLHDLADVDLEAQLVRVFTARLGTLDDEARRPLAAALRAARQGDIAVRSAFALSPQQQQRLAETLQEQASSEVTPRFVTDPEMGLGIELKAGGWKLAWSLEGYLHGLEARFAAALDCGKKVPTPNHPLNHR